jgi:hypothetical protein
MGSNLSRQFDDVSEPLGVEESARAASEPREAASTTPQGRPESSQAVQNTLERQLEDERLTEDDREADELSRLLKQSLSKTVSGIHASEDGSGGSTHNTHIQIFNRISATGGSRLGVGSNSSTIAHDKASPYA